MRTQRKVYVVVLGVAGAVFGVDKFFLQPEGGAGGLAKRVGESIERTLASGTALPGGDVLSVAQQLQSFGVDVDLEGVQNAFALGTSPQGIERAAPAVPEADKGDPFGERYRVTSILNMGPDSIVQIIGVGSDGSTVRKSVRIGDTVDGHTLVRIEHVSVTFEARGKETSLDLPQAQFLSAEAGQN